MPPAPRRSPDFPPEPAPVPSRPLRPHPLVAVAVAASLSALPACQREPTPSSIASLPLSDPSRPIAVAPPPPSLLPPPPTAQATAPSLPPPSSPSVALPPASVALAPPPERPFVLVELAPTQGDLTPLVRDHAERARAQGRKPFVEFYADWCGPCQALHRALDDPRMIDAFRGTTILRLNVDDWREKLPGTGFVPREIPVFYAVNAGGRPTGRSLQGLSWGKSVPENMAPKLKAFFGG